MTDKMTPDSLRDAIHQVAGQANAPYTPPHLMQEASAAPGMFTSTARKIIEAGDRWIPTLEMWARSVGPQEQAATANVKKAIAKLQAITDKVEKTL